MLNIDTLSRFIKDNDLIERKDRIVLGVSGGADSTCLLHILSRIQKALEIRLFVVHINHGIRGEEAGRDENFVRELCKELNIDFFAFYYDIPKMAAKLGLSEEEAGRKVRYETFEKVSKSISKSEGADIVRVRIAVAHNKNDNAETVLHNLSRGSGISGLKGILAKNGKIIRPLIAFTREEVEDYLQKNNISYMTDSTNVANEYTRNVLRNEVFPILKENVNSNVINNFYKSSGLIAEADEYFENLAMKFCEKNFKNTDSKEFLLNKEKLLETPHILGTYIIRYCLKEILSQQSSGIKDIGMVHIEDIWNLAKSENGKKIDLKYSIKVYNEYRDLRFVNEQKSKASKSDIILPEIRYEILEDCNINDIPKEGNIRWLDFDKVIENIVKYNRGSLFINSNMNKDDKMKAVNENITIRKCRSGDFISIKSGKKAIKKLFTDEKVVKSIRNEHAVLAIQSDVLWIFRAGGTFGEGLDRSGEFYNVCTDTKNILKVELIRSEHERED